VAAIDATVVRMDDLLSRTDLNRATLARQLLLDRAPLSVPEALEHLVGLQGQAPDAPYVGLWSRLADFVPDDLGALVADGRAVRTPLMRATVHLVTAADRAALRPLVQPVLDRAWTSSPFARQLGGATPAEVLAVATPLLAAGPLTRAELSAALAPHWPDADPTSLAYAATFLQPLIQAPPRGIWGRRAPAAWTTAPEVPVAPATLDDLVLRYLGAFGPASVKDAQLWSGLTRLREVADRLLAAGRLRRFRDEDGRELLDLPDAPRPGADVPVPPRFLPEYDNLLLSHADRARVNPDGRPVPLPPGNGGTVGTFLVDGVWSGTWQVAGALTVVPFGPLSAADESALVAEGERLLSFVTPDETPEVHVVAPDSA
jgi:hypothetical protein